MLQLPESSRRSRRSTRGLATSVVLHAAVIGVVVVGTARGTPAPDAPPSEQLLYVAPPAAPAPAAPAPPRETSAPRADAPRIPTMPVPALPTPVMVPDVVAPPGPATLPPDFFERRALGAAPGGDGVPGGTPGGTGTLPADGAVWSSHLVEREVVPLGGTAPRYPDALRGAGVEGEVVVEFVVDSTGRVELPTVTVVQRAHPLFEQAVRQALRGMRFRPAQAGGRAVRQLVRQPFTFAITR